MNKRHFHRPLSNRINCLESFHLKSEIAVAAIVLDPAYDLVVVNGTDLSQLLVVMNLDVAEHGSPAYNDSQA